jgi:type II secretion system protein G
MNRRGFTLIELLVVIAIIGMLASIVLAALGSTRVSARDTRRLVDLREIGKAIERYYIDVGDYPRTAGWCTNISNPSNNWGPDFQADIAPYLSKVPLDPLYANTYQDYFYYNLNDQSYYLYAELEGSDRADDGFAGCARIGGTNNEYDLRYPTF